MREGEKKSEGERERITLTIQQPTGEPSNEKEMAFYLTPDVQRYNMCEFTLMNAEPTCECLRLLALFVECL